MVLGEIDSVLRGFEDVFVEIVVVFTWCFRRFWGVGSLNYFSSGGSGYNHNNDKRIGYIYSFKRKQYS